MIKVWRNEFLEDGGIGGQLQSRLIDIAYPTIRNEDEANPASDPSFCNESPSTIILHNSYYSDLHNYGWKNIN